MHQPSTKYLDDDGSTLLRSIDTLSEEIQDKISISQSKIDMKSELLEQYVNKIKSAFEELHVILYEREDTLLDALKKESEESVKSQETFMKEAETFADSLNKLQGDIKNRVPIENPIAVNAYRRKIDVMGEQFKGLYSKVFEPVFVTNKREMNFLAGVRGGHIKREAFYKLGTKTEGAEEEVNINVNDSETFSLHRKGVDQHDSIITSIVWKNGRIIATDKSNHKLKIFTDEGKFLHEFLFSNAEPYCVAALDSVDDTEYFAVTFPKAKYIYFISFEGTEVSKPPSIWLYCETKIGYSGVCQGPNRNQIFCTVVMGEPRIDLLDFKGNILQTFIADVKGQHLFSFPRYVLTNANSLIVSDHKRNEVIFLSYEGAYLGHYMGVRGHPLVNPFDITFDGEGNIYVVDGKTGDIHVFDPQFRTISIIRCGSTLLNPRLLDYNIETNRLAITHGAGDVTMYPVTSEYKIEEFDTGEELGQGSKSDYSPSMNRRSAAGAEGLLMAPEVSGRASPGF